MASNFNHHSAMRAIRDKGLSVTFVAEKLGMNRAVLSNILNGNRRGSVALAVQIAEVTGDNPYSFLGPDDPKAAVVELAHALGVTGADLDAVGQ